MAVVKVACPYCGEVANATVNSKSDEIAEIGRSQSSSRNYHSACKECGSRFHYALNS
ncbi:hypothetical protein [Halolamina sediminis]|jgi:DNA-directed RNA polymerase subunit RPC12/RpoP|uniref:hypothetical protein n=1 Tax=Halolamina sediminis TaxID=1480675 RepID=UPI0012ABDA9B|nr:hypothetical protein [Halolamina sediminis]